jgi:hypothetical protein
MIYEPCSWYKNIKRNSHLDNFIEERSIDAPSVYCDNNTQTMVVNYIQCVKLDEIEKIEAWSPDREDTIRKWATPDKLRRLRYHEEETGKRVIPYTAFHDMPMLSREYKLDNNKQEKFKISDGIHRINRARELCKTESCDCILASVEEHVKINRTDTKNVEVK